MSSFFRRLCSLAFLSLFVGVLPASWAQTDQKVSLMIYLDLSRSMDDKREQVAAMAEYITKNLEIQCGDYEIGVSNILYKDVPSAGGEMIARTGEPLFITKTTPNGKELLKQRINVNNEPSPERSTTPYASGIQEMTYTSVAATLARHISQAPSQLKNSLAVGTLILSDAAPFYELMSPAQAVGQIQSQLEGRPFIAGAVGAREIGRCLDAPPFSNGNQISESNIQNLGLLQEFSMLSGGYYWNMCRPLDIEQSVRDFLLMLTETAGCMLIS